jgi:hypothetical protein
MMSKTFYTQAPPARPRRRSASRQLSSGVVRFLERPSHFVQRAMDAASGILARYQLKSLLTR